MLPLLVIALPLVEIAGFVVVGGAIGVLPTLGLVVASALVGAVLVRIQGLGLLAQMQTEIERGAIPGRELAHGAMILLAGLLLIIPGFVSDIAGLLLFLPPLRQAVIALMLHRTNNGTMRPRGPRPRPQPPTIELSDNEYSSPPNPASPWNGGRPG